MALKKCSECGGMNAESTERCPHCGKETTNGCVSWFLYIGIAYFIWLFIYEVILS